MAIEIVSALAQPAMNNANTASNGKNLFMLCRQ
jgi:hypothetical protein